MSNITFNKGMSYDNSESFPSEGLYRFLQNGGIDGKDSSSMEITNKLGNKEITVLTASDTQDVQRPSSTFGYRGSIQVKKDILIFYRTIDSLVIDLLKFKEEDPETLDKTYVVIPLLQLPEANVSEKTGKEKITGIGKYISPDNIKVYFTEKSTEGRKYLRDLRYINIAPDVIDGELQDPFLLSSYSRVTNLTLDDMEILGKFDNKAPEFNDYGNGTLRNGTVQYAYRYYKYKGHKTLWSDLTPEIPIFPSSQSNIIELKGGVTVGDEEDMNSGKSVILDVPSNSNYDYVEILRLWYSKVNQVPEAMIVTRRSMSSKLTIEDGLHSTDYGVLDAGEILNLSSKFNAKTIVEKDDRLYCSNLYQSSFDLDYDARVYRFNSIGNCLLYNESNYSTPEHSFNTTNYSSYITTIPKDNDVINKSNILSYDDTISDPFDRDQNGDLGAKGININLAFEIIDLNTYVPTSEKTNQSITESNRDYILGIKRLFQPDEIYRFGIVFFDEYGRSSDVKYIGDIRMPKRLDDVSENEKVYIPKFNVTTSGTEAEGYNYKIVYVKRDRQDRTFLMEGIILPHREDSDVNSIRVIPNLDFITNSTNSYNGCFLYSPENSFDYDLNLNNKRFDFIGNLFNNKVKETTRNFGNGDSYILYRKYNTSLYTGVPNDSSYVSEYFNLKPSDSNSIIPTSTMTSTIDTVANNVKSSFNREGVDVNIWGRGTSCYYIREVPESLKILPFGDYTRYGSIRNDIIQYGGRGYNSRISNTYISASEVSSGESSMYLYRGDTFKSVFELQRVIWPYEKYETDYKYSETISFPVYSSINLNLRQDDYYSSIGSEEAAQVSEEGLTLTDYVQDYYRDREVDWSPLYIYNSVYSAKEYIDRFSAKDSTKLSNIHHYNMVSYSEKEDLNKFYDTLLDFKPFNYNETSKELGDNNYMIEHNDKLLVFQDSGISIARINERALLNQEGSETLLLGGSGKALDGFSYLSKSIGVQGISEVIKSPSSLYWIDINNRKYYTLSQEGIISLSDIKSMSTWFDKTIRKNIEYNGIYDKKNTSVLLTVKDISDNIEFNDIYFDYLSLVGNILTIEGNTDNVLMKENNIYTLVQRNSLGNIIKGNYKLNTITSTQLIFEYMSGDTPLSTIPFDMSMYINLRNTYTLTFNEKFSIFENVLTFSPKDYLKGIDNYYTISKDNDIYEHNKGNYGEYYGDVYPMIIDFIFTPEHNSVYNMIELYTKVLDGIKDSIGSPERVLSYDQIENKTFDAIQSISDGKVSDFVELYTKTGEQETEILANTQSTDNFADTTYDNNIRTLRDTSGIAISPYPIYFYNTRKQGERFISIIPRIRSKRTDENDRDINYSISGNYIRLRLVYYNTDNKLIKFNRAVIGSGIKLI